MLEIYSIYDKKVGTYMRPVFVAHLVEVQRDLSSVMANKESLLAKFPSDYEVYRLGKFDDKKGMMDLEDKPVFIMNISELEAPANV